MPPRSPVLGHFPTSSGGSIALFSLISKQTEMGKNKIKFLNEPIIFSESIGQRKKNVTEIACFGSFSHEFWGFDSFVLSYFIAD